MLNKAADFHVKTGHGREISKEEAYAILKRAEENGLIHELSNTDGTGEVSGICNCCECSCLSLRGGRLFNDPTIMKSNYRAQVDKEKCVACGQCVENCQMNALRLGQKLCSTQPLNIRKSETPDDKIWTKEHWNEDWRENRENVVETGTAERAETIDLARAQASERRARQRLESRAANVDLKRAELSLQRAIAREKAYTMLHK